MDLLRKDLEPLLSTVSSWLSRPNIVGLDVGKKRIDNKETDTWAIVVYVEKKKIPSKMGKEDFPIPKEIELHLLLPDGGYREVQVPTDVVESGPVTLQVLDQKKRPCPGGYQIQGKGISGRGTLGVNIVWGGRYRLLTNNHVISLNGINKNNVYQPENSWGNSLTSVTSYVPVVTYPNQNQNNPVFNTQDLAWCDITTEEGASNIYLLGNPTGIRAPVIGERVRIVGKQTGTMMHAIILSLTFRGIMEFTTGQWAWFKNLIQLDSRITQPGDSGAAYMADDGKIVGIHMAASSLNSFGCLIT